MERKTYIICYGKILKKLNCYFCNYKNFGDQLNHLIFLKEIDYKIRWTTYDRASLMGIGSIIEAIIEKPSESRKKNKELIFCFSSGFAREEQVTDLVKQNLEIKLLRPVEYIAIRGEKTKKILIENKMMDIECNPVIADGGLLASDLLNKCKRKKYEVGIVAHAQEKNSPEFKKIHNLIPNSKILNIQKSPIKFLEDLSECETIISTAMHPLIVADSLGIPNLWIRLSEEKSATQKFKFNDYYSAFGLEKNPYDINKINNDAKQLIINKYNVPKEIVEQKKQELRDSLTELKKQLIREERKYNKMYVRNSYYMYMRFYPKKYIIEYPIRVVKKLGRIVLQK